MTEDQKLILYNAVREAAIDYIAREWEIVVLRQQTKKCRDEDWLKRTYKPDDFKPGQNIGIKWVKGLVDVDLDCSEAVFMAEVLLPRTTAVWGHASHPRSHWLFYCEGIDPVAHKDFVPKDKKEKKPLVEIRVNHQSMAPPSIHPDGEQLAWVQRDFEVMKAYPAFLRRQVQLVATGAAIAKYYNSPGNRHDWGLALAGTLRRLTLTSGEAERIIKRAAEWQGQDREIQDRLSAIRNTYALSDDQPMSGATTLAELSEHGDGFARTLTKIWGAKVAQADDGKSIIVNSLTPRMIDRAWGHLTKANEPPGVFRRQHEVAILHNSANTCIEALYQKQLQLTESRPMQRISGFRTVDADTFREILARMVPCVQATNEGFRECFPPPDLARLMLASPVLPLPEPEGFTTVPFFTQDGTLVTTPGLHRETGMFYQPQPRFALPAIPDNPSKIDVASAVRSLDEMVWEFPFKGRQGTHPYALDLMVDCDWRQTAAYANMLAFPLTVLTRSLFHAVPLFLFDKPTTRTGASLLVQCWCYVLTGAWPSEAEWDGSEAERRKFLTAILMTGTPIIFLDEVKDLKSPDLNKILTGKAARVGRVLGKSEITMPTNYAVFVATGINPLFPKDMAGRMCRSRLDADMSKPSARVGWDKDLMAWVPEHRLELLAALYTIVRAWFAAGRPESKQDRVLNGFEPWSYTIGGVLEHAGLTGFLANKKDVEEDAEDEDEGDDFDAFLIEWVEGHEGDEMAIDVLLLSTKLPQDNGQPFSSKQLARRLGQNRDKRIVLSDGREVRITRIEGRRRWRLRLLSGLIAQATDTEQDSGM